MAPQLTWSRLVPGLVAVTAIAAATVALLLFGSVGRVSGEKIRLYVVTNSARGVMKGTEVWLAGQKVGIVDDISFRSPRSDTLARVVLAIDVRRSDADQIRHDSDIRVRAGANVVGPIVLYVTAGTPGSAGVRNGDTLFASAQSDLQSAMKRLGGAIGEFGPLAADARVVMSHVRDRAGTIGAFMHGGAGQFSEMSSRIHGLLAQPGRNAAARAEFVGGVRSVLAQVDSIRLLLRDERSSLGRFRRDTSLGRALAMVHDDVAAIQARLRVNPGTLGRFASDSAIQRALASARAELDTLMEDVRKRPLRYIAF